MMMGHEAKYYRVKGEVLVCELCPHMCQLSAGETGKCRTRTNRQGQLITDAYANPCTLHIDPVEKKPLYHVLPGTSTLSLSTAGCNLACLNCQNNSISQVAPKELKNLHLTPANVVQMALDKACASISYTYTDPVVYYEYMLDTACLAKAEGLKNNMVSAGYINPQPLDELVKYLDAANIDLKCFDDAIYQTLCGIRLKLVLNTLLTLKRAGVWLEITNLVIPGYSDDLTMIEKMLDWLITYEFQNVPIHFNRFVPSHRLNHVNATPTEQLLSIAALARDKGLQYVYVGNIGTNTFSYTHCPHCNIELIKRQGYATYSDIKQDGKCFNCHGQVHGIWE